MRRIERKTANMNNTKKKIYPVPNAEPKAQTADSSVSGTVQSNAQKLASFLNTELRMKPERVNAVMEELRERFPQVMWDIPEEC